MKTTLLASLFALTLVPVQELPAPAPQLAEHRWLQQLVGEWQVRSEATLEPGAEPMVVESTESVRGLGGLWVLAEGHVESEGSAITSLMTLGYDPRREVFVGTWIDSMQAYLWTYEGRLDETKKILTLETEGPSWDDPGRLARYRDVIEVKGPNSKSLKSMVQGGDGLWTTFMRSESRRKP